MDTHSGETALSICIYIQAEKGVYSKGIYPFRVDAFFKRGLGGGGREWGGGRGQDVANAVSLVQMAEHLPFFFFFADLDLYYLHTYLFQLLGQAGLNKQWMCSNFRTIMAGSKDIQIFSVRTYLI